MNVPEWRRSAITLLVFAAVFIALTVSSYTRESATWDEPQHVVAGYNALRFHDYRTDPEHPPFIRMWAALPLLAVNDIKVDRSKIDQTTPYSWVTQGQFFFCHDVFYVANDADRLLYLARFMIVVLGVLLGVLLFCWTRELLGFWPATMVLGLYTVEPNLLAHARLVTTDFGVTCFIFGTMYFLWRTTRLLSFSNLCGLAGFFVLAQVSKFSALLLGPIVLALLVVRTFQEKPWVVSLGRQSVARNRVGKLAITLSIVAMLAAATWLAIWAVYDFRYLPSASPTWRWDFQQDPIILQRAPLLAKAVGWVDEHRLLPNAYVQGFLLGQVKAQKRSGFFAGTYSIKGWWYFFPVAFLIKTPIAVILLFFTGVVLCAVRWRRFLDHNAYVLLPLAAFLGAAMMMNLNIGVRHILPIQPLVLLLAGNATAELYASQRKPLRMLLGTLGLLAVTELAFVCPHYLAFFNQFAGGPRNGHEYLVDSNLDWGQDLKSLKHWMDEHEVRHINLSYFGTADPAYYKIDCTYLPGGAFFDEPLVRNPQLPGFVAVSVTNLRGVYFSERSRNIYQGLLETAPVAVIGYSIYVYQVERPWWQ
ncbi:MAG TPA: glycosyltransferase family 39 protein [Verrucomicrobiae bacterium]|nr:glycosyltransferase family 39 protein [Verrucomicrobiae bacterium]